MTEGLSIAELYGSGLGTAGVVLLYKMQRDLRDVVKEHQRLQTWVARIKAHLWPELFSGDK